MDDRIRELIDSSRPGIGDLEDPEFAELAAGLQSNPEIKEVWTRSQQFDQVVGRAVRDLPIPDGLANRILAKLKNQDATGIESIHEDVQTAPSDPIATKSLATNPASTRRRWMRRVGFLAAASATVLVTMAFIHWMRAERLVTVSQLAQAIHGWTAQIPDEWQAMEALPYDAARPFDQLRHEPFRWQTFRTEFDQQAVLYQLNRGRGAAILFVIQAPSVRFQVGAKATLLQSTGGWDVAAWQSNGILCILAVQEGPGPRLEDYLQPQNRLAKIFRDSSNSS